MWLNIDGVSLANGWHKTPCKPVESVHFQASQAKKNTYAPNPKLLLKKCSSKAGPLVPSGASQNRSRSPQMVGFLLVSFRMPTTRGLTI